jgi:DNA-3-methyladenine glycosylase
MKNSIAHEVIPLSFYGRDDVVQIARDLLGMRLFHQINGVVTGGRIVETEAYCGAMDRACHAFGKRTPRNEIMFGPPGRGYIYLCYGIFHLFNVVTNVEGKADAVLIRALEPEEGLDEMAHRTRKSDRMASGPGLVGRAMGFHHGQSGISLMGPEVWLTQGDPVRDIVSRPRIGVDYAGEDAKLPWRFYEAGNRYVSKK